MAAEGKDVDLGFVEETDSWRLLSHYFPSKVGGKPAWLSLNPVPNAKDVACGNCGDPCIFLIQVYAPVEGEPTCFHRTVYVFICAKPACSETNSNKNFVVLRSQLPRENTFYSDEPPNEDNFDPDVVHPHAGRWQSLCVLCGLHGSFRCSRCHRAAYCGKVHQVIDYKAGHKAACMLDSDAEDFSGRHKKFLIPEFEMAIAPEEYKEEAAQEKSDDQKMKEYEELVASASCKKATIVGPADDKDLEKMGRAETDEDKVFKKFQKRIKHEPEQVLRYDKGGKPLWVSSESVPAAKDIPKCSCGEDRQFEFQVLPQLLCYLKLDLVEESVDWGMLAVYTCKANCGADSLYQKEFLWKQDFLKTDSV